MDDHETIIKYNIGNNLIHVDTATIRTSYQRSFHQWQYWRMVPHYSRCPPRVHIIPTLLNIFLERIMSDVLEEHEGTVSITGRTITNLRFADDIGGLAGSEQELAQLVERIDQTSKAYGMEINAEETKLMTNNINGIHKEIKASDYKLQTVTNFKYLGAIISDAGSKAGIFQELLNGLPR